jgi:PAS domain S-box-containing protein
VLSQDELATVVSIASDAMIAVDERQRVVFFNEGAERVFGYSREEMLGEPLEILLPPRFRRVHAGLVRAFAAGPDVARRMGERTGVLGLRKDGTEFPAEASIARASGGDAPILLVVLRDVTEQRAAHEALLERQRQLAEAQRIARLGSWEWDIAADRVTWSEELYRIYGLPPDVSELRLATFLERVVPEDRGKARKQVERAAAAGGNFEFEERIRRPDGEVRLLRSSGRVLLDHDGRPTRLLGVCQDITEQRAAEEAASRLAAETRARTAAQEAEARMTFLAAASRELASSLDSETTLRAVARLAVPTIADWAAVDIIDDAGNLRRLAVQHSDPAKVQLAIELAARYPPDPAAAYGVHSIVRTGKSQYLEEIPDEVLEQSAQDEEHLRMIRQLGLRSYLAVPLSTGDNAVLGAMVLVYAESGRRYTEQDRLLAEDLGRRAAVAIENARLVTQLRDARTRLQEQAEELELQAEELAGRNLELQQQSRALVALSNAKSDFMATVSHELRTPLNAIIGYAELLHEGVPQPVPEPARTQVERIRLGAKHLLQLIEEILTFSSLEAGRQQVTIERIPMGELLAELQAIIEPLAAREGLQFSVRADGAPGVLVSDGNKVRQILVNLLSNAIKFTERGRVELDVGAADGLVKFAVRDTGPGISAADQARLFEPFWQADQSRTRRAQGAGLGLTISDRLARMLDGEITVDSSVGAGSVFTLSLPAEPPAGQNAG